MESNNPNPFDSTTDISENDYSALIDYLQEEIKVTDRVDACFHFLKYHDCLDREIDFLNVLKNNLVYYCFSKDRYTNKKASEIASLVFEGRDKFFNPKDSEPVEGRKVRLGSSRTGEFGEIALYFLLESFLKAPQIVSKMSLKTTQGENFKGSDGIHIGYHNNKNSVIFCESKVNKLLNSALQDCIKSVLDFSQNKRSFEISIINNHIDIKDDKLKQAVIDFLDPSKEKGDDWVEIHACFIGFNWPKFVDIERETDNSVLLNKLKSELKQEIESVKNYLASELEFPKVKQRFYFFIMPFKDIDVLRTNFLAMLYGTK